MKKKLMYITTIFGPHQQVYDSQVFSTQLKVNPQIPKREAIKLPLFKLMQLSIMPAVDFCILEKFSTQTPTRKKKKKRGRVQTFLI